jgi:hypothetical protein
VSGIETRIQRQRPVLFFSGELSPLGNSRFTASAHASCMQADATGPAWCQSVCDVTKSLRGPSSTDALLADAQRRSPAALPLWPLFSSEHRSRTAPQSLSRRVPGARLWPSHVACQRTAGGWNSMTSNRLGVCPNHASEETGSKTRSQLPISKALCPNPPTQLVCTEFSSCECPCPGKLGRPTSFALRSIHVRLTKTPLSAQHL